MSKAALGEGSLPIWRAKLACYTLAEGQGTRLEAGLTKADRPSTGLLDAALQWGGRSAYIGIRNTRDFPPWP